MLQASGFWVVDRAGGSPQHVESGPDSSVWSHWRPRDGIEARHIERCVDWLLDHAAAGRSERAFRAAYPGSRIEIPGSTQDQFWHRNLIGLRGGAQTSAYGVHQRSSAADRSQQGLIIDDTKENTNIAGFGRHAGPGRGHSNPGYGNIHGQPGSHGTGSHPVPASNALEALVTNSYTRATLHMGGGGGNARSTGGQSTSSGASAGSGVARVRNTHFTESMNFTLTGSSSGGAQYRGGGGSGGGYYAIVQGNFVLTSTVVLSGGSRNGGNGRFTIFNTGTVTINGTVTNGVQTFFQLYPAIPFGGVLVM